MATTEAENKEIVRKLPEKAVNEGNLDVIDRIVADDYVSRSPLFPEPVHGPEELKEAFSIFRTAFPDLEYTVEDVIAEGDKVVRRDRITGTHEGPFMVVEPTGNEVEIEGIGIFRVEDGLLVESWCQGDTSFIQQLELDPLEGEFLRGISFRGVVSSHIRGMRRATVCGTTVEYQVDSVPEAGMVDYLTRSERVVLTDLLTELQHGDVFFDIGANYGLYTCLAGQVLDPSDVYAVEPYPPNLPRLRTNLELNETPNVHIVEKAFADADGEVAFDPPERKLALEGMSRVRPTESDGYTVETVRGDTFCSDDVVSEPDVLKIDVEGAELNVLEGFRETIASSTCRTIYCEIHADESEPISVTDYGASEDDVETLLVECGFDVVTLERRLGDRHIKATK